MGSLVSCSSRVKMEFLSFLFGNAFSSSHSSFISLADSNLSIADAIFAQEASDGGSEIELNCSIVEMSGGRLTIYYFWSADGFPRSGKAVHAAGVCIQLQRSGIRPHSSQLQRLPAPEHLDERNSERIKRDCVFLRCESLVSVECQETDVEMNFFAVSNIVFVDGCAVRVTLNASTFHLKLSSFQNITRNSLGPCCLAASSSSMLREFDNCSSHKRAMKAISIANSLKGGLSVSGRSISVQFGLFDNNSPNVTSYPSMRNNIVCSDHALLNIRSLKGGDGLKGNSSLWVLNLGCNLSGIVSERASPFFILQLASVKSHQQGNTLAIDLAGSLLLPCGLSLQVDSFDG
ncbi:uncharacterized protein MONOS_13251 [Monocercomonoides exilis]|uniref:uncharacterized protein n=1 Tax=Monocercomonoides exilis TaxID=2049356 RepID=UPI003559738E|nr:hypothetical protein MONOS_13251 [Monocercomonoides exilis]|eukprot:MONOS_13251.1-p1 / transcript=MONOS_13251.1 / gene=MONOS_13251 / organism=Monocercomonoides_exilis_PA203 / gene_product=unspecified product / transcript_product=unspecified product / location=Mono_scaffold00798:7047-8423(+) / protein_length=347 / sequence_SO=supercontig / SO=protein_coding / is_pseudo=false